MTTLCLLDVESLCIVLAARDEVLMLRAGTVVDATLIAALTSTNNSSGQRDPEMHQAKKGNQ